MAAADSSVLALFHQTGAYLHGHFRLTSGLHSPEYLQCALVLQHPEHAQRCGQILAARLRSLHSGKIDVVAAPAMGGLIIGHEVARALGARFVFTERENGRMTLRRGFRIEPGETALVIEDVITTGGSLREVADLLRAAGAAVVGAGSIIDRSEGAAQIGAPFTALETLKVTTSPPEECPLCRDGVPVTKPGSRAA